VTFSATDIYRIADGKKVEEWNTLEQFDVLSQPGPLPRRSRARSNNANRQVSSRIRHNNV
jgi:hypothetical protein